MTPHPASFSHCVLLQSDGLLQNFTHPKQRLMEPARAALEQALSAVEVRAPRVKVWSNVTAQPFPSDPVLIRQLLARQLVEPVQWEATLVVLTGQAEAGGAGGAAGGGAGGSEAAGKLFELGPGQQIKSMVRRISGEAWKAMMNVSVA